MREDRPTPYKCYRSIRCLWSLAMANATFVYAIRGARGRAFRVKKVGSGRAWFIESEADLFSLGEGRAKSQATRNPPDLPRGSRRRLRSEQRERERERFERPGFANDSAASLDHPLIDSPFALVASRRGCRGPELILLQGSSASVRNANNVDLFSEGVRGIDAARRYGKAARVDDGL